MNQNKTPTLDEFLTICRQELSYLKEYGFTEVAPLHRTGENVRLFEAYSPLLHLARYIPSLHGQPVSLIVRLDKLEINTYNCTRENNR